MSEASGLHLAVGRLEQDRERRLVHGRRACEQRGERVVLGRELLAPEEQQADVVRTSGGEIAHELDGDRDPALHVARAHPVHGAVGDATREPGLVRDGVVVPGEEDQWYLGAPRRDEEVRLVAGVLLLEPGGNERQQMLADAGLVAALRGNVDELERPRREALGEPAHGRSLPPRSPRA